MQVVDIMRVNVEKVLERDKKLTELDDRAGLRLADVFVPMVSMDWTTTWVLALSIDYGAKVEMHGFIIYLSYS